MKISKTKFVCYALISFFIIETLLIFKYVDTLPEVSRIFRGISDKIVPWKTHTEIQQFKSNVIKVIQQISKSKRYERNKIYKTKLSDILSRLAQIVNTNNTRNLTKENHFLIKDTTLILNCCHENKFKDVLHILKKLSQHKYNYMPVIVGMLKDDFRKHSLKLKEMFQERLPCMIITQLSWDDETLIVFAQIFILLKNVKTKHVIVSRNLQNIDSLNMLPRLIKPLKKEVDVVSSTSIDAEGNWDLGCYQTKAIWFQYKLQAGYDFSNNDGYIYCDYTSLTFATKRSLLWKYIILPGLNEFHSDTLYLHFFNYLKNNHNSPIKVCTDCIFSQNVAQLYEIPRKQLLLFSEQFEFSDIYIQTQEPTKFLCKELNAKCTAAPLGLFMHKCCINELDELLTTTAVICEHQKLEITLDGGTIVGSAKLTTTLPWERDHDLEFRSAHFRKLESISSTFETKGYSLGLSELDDECVSNVTGSLTCGYVGVNSKHWRMELWGQNLLIQDYYEKPKTPLKTSLIKGNGTKTEISGFWIKSKASPGLYSRSRYGLDVLRHQKHWGVLGYGNSFTDYHPKAKWASCIMPESHACSSNYLTDGNIQFRKPWV